MAIRYRLHWFWNKTCYGIIRKTWLIDLNKRHSSLQTNRQFAGINFSFFRRSQFFFKKDAHKHRVVLWQINASSNRGSILHRSTVQRQLTMDTDNTIYSFSLSLRLSSWGTKQKSIFRLVVFSSSLAREIVECQLFCWQEYQVGGLRFDLMTISLESVNYSD